MSIDLMRWIESDLMALNKANAEAYKAADAAEGIPGSDDLAELAEPWPLCPVPNPPRDSTGD